LLAKLFDHYGMAMTVQQHALVGSTVRSYLSYLCDTKRLSMSVLDNQMRWQKA
jgi:hypothetical protein